jgi:hypothetical protein
MVTPKWTINNARWYQREKHIPIFQFRENILKVHWKSPFPLNKCFYNVVNTCKLDSKVKIYSEILRKTNVFGFFGYDV